MDVINSHDHESRHFKIFARIVRLPKEACDQEKKMSNWKIFESCGIVATSLHHRHDSLKADVVFIVIADASSTTLIQRRLSLITSLSRPVGRWPTFLEPKKIDRRGHQQNLRVQEASIHEAPCRRRCRCRRCWRASHSGRTTSRDERARCIMITTATTTIGGNVEASQIVRPQKTAVERECHQCATIKKRRNLRQFFGSTQTTLVA